MRYFLLVVALALVACSKPLAPVPAPVASASASALGATAGKSTVVVVNDTAAAATVYLAFGADSVVLPAAFPFCTSQPPAALSCSFQLGAKASQVLPLAGQYLNVTMAFNAPVNCGSTKAEVNVNNPAWYDTLDVSLVDGFSNGVEIQTGTVMLAAFKGTGNEKALGVFPLGCDICVARQHPPCGQTPGRDGCKAGTQYAPAVPCQWQGAVKGGGTPVRVVLVAGVPV
jgi:hypothetical protein